MEDMVNISVGTAGIVGLLGYLVVFFGLILLMLVVMIMASVFIRKAKKNAEAPAPAEEEAVKETAPVAPGSAGELKLYNTDPRDAAMIMAIVADQLGKPINELRFKSIKEVTSDEI